MDHYYQTFEAALDENEKSEQKWLKWKDELKETRKNLNEFVKSYSFDIMVPIGKKAFVRGQLLHTNEITVCHGSTGIFSDVSTNQALDLIEHRIKVCDTNLEGIRKERDLYKAKIDLPENAFAKDDGQEIIEEYDEARETQWRLDHAESVRKQKQIEAQERNKDAKDEDVLTLLDKHEMMEELAEEMENLTVEDDETFEKLMKGEIKVPESKARIAHDTKNVDTSSNSQNHQFKTNISSDLPHCVPMESQPVCDSNNNDLIAKNNQEIIQLLKAYRGKIKDVLKNVKKNDEGSLNLYLDLIELKEDIDDDIRKMIDEEEETSDEDEVASDSDDLTASASIEVDDERLSAAKSRKRKVRFSTSLEDVKLIEPVRRESCSDSSNSDTSENNTIEIKFKHSDAMFNAFTDPDIVSHPGDIKTKFPQFPQPLVVTKSILKTKTTSDSAQSPLEPDNPVVKKIYQSEFPMIGDVVEHSKQSNGHDVDESLIIVAAKDNVPKKISKFREMRRLKS